MQPKILGPVGLTALAKLVSYEGLSAAAVQGMLALAMCH